MNDELNVALNKLQDYLAQHKKAITNEAEHKLPKNEYDRCLNSIRR